ncbi:hypothetical protein GCM10009613_12550 [Pseudonocardia kongjuensis]|uniref:PNPLA domain-containing protein n=1 Tax=Pseudonocardia kongjuensis TaxID=102227 RepID=A0ABN1XKA0_9PSEU
MSTSVGPRRIAIACQGGGSHTAFTAGVLARMLRTGAFDGTEIVGLSGTSGGAICALVAWDRLRHGDDPEHRAAAADALEAFWADNAARGPIARLQNAGMVWAGALQGLGLLPASTPYAIPRPIDGTRQFLELLGRHVDFDAIAADPAGREPLLLLGAVDVLDGRFRAFSSRTDTISGEMVLASAAIPNLFRAVHADGGVYWDGLFSQNPPVRDLLDTDPDELWVIQINPSRIRSEPRTLVEISERRNALAGNLSLNQELGFIETIDRLLADGELRPEAGYRHVTVRILEMPSSVIASRILGSASKLNRDGAFLERLQRRGATQADRFLGALAFERAVRERDAAGLAAAIAPDARLWSTAPFRERAPGGSPLADAVGEILAGEFAIDTTRKQVARDDAVWAVRISSPDGDRAEGLARATLDAQGRVTALRLGPAG